MKMLILIISTIAISYCCGLYMGMYIPKKDNSIKFVWNYNEQSIPSDGELIKIEATDENTIYIGPINN
jgi:hypothetical protein